MNAMLSILPILLSASPTAEKTSEPSAAPARASITVQVSATIISAESVRISSGLDSTDKSSPSEKSDRIVKRTERGEFVVEFY